MEQDTNKLIDDQFKALPEPLQRAISLTPWRELVKGIAIAQNLDTDKAEGLETETMLVMYGFQNQDDLALNIATEIGLTQEAAQKVSGEIINKIFEVVLAKADELAKENGATLQNLPESKPETQEIAPKVVVEMPTQEASKSINLIPPAAKPEELKLEPPKLGESLTSLAPAKTPAAPVEKPKNLIAERLNEVVTTPAKSSSYPGGVDPYREPV